MAPDPLQVNGRVYWKRGILSGCSPNADDSILTIYQKTEIDYVDIILYLISASVCEGSLELAVAADSDFQPLPL